LKGLRPKYEAHHKAKLTDEALETAVRFSDRYITGRFLPDKAIDVMDEAGARARINAMTRPPDVKDIEKEIEAIRVEKEGAIKAQDFEKAASLRDKEKQTKEKLDAILTKWREEREEKEVVVTGDDMMHIISKVTGVPLQKMEERETQKLLRMEAELKDRVIGQDEAVTAISKALRRSRADLKDPKRPIGSFVFLGPTGVGKTYLARTLAEFMFGDADALIQIDMSEYMEKFTASRLIGSPPGYVGYEEGGQLSEAVRRRPYSVVLFDEIEKAHPDVMHLLLQILEDGKITDSLGRKIDFRNTIIIMTSNVGADLLKKQTVMVSARRVRDTITIRCAIRFSRKRSASLSPSFSIVWTKSLCFIRLANPSCCASSIWKWTKSLRASRRRKFTSTCSKARRNSSSTRATTRSMARARCAAPLSVFWKIRWRKNCFVVT